VERLLRAGVSRPLPGAFAAALVALLLWLASGASAAASAAAAMLAAAAFLAGGRTLDGAGARARREAESARLEADLARAEARRTREEAESARAERDDLQRTLAHDLRSPLGAIVNFTSVLEEDQRGRLDAEAMGILARIRRAAESGLQLADGLARLAQVSRAPLHPERVDVEPLVREVFARLAGGTPRVELSLAELPPAHADRALLREAFTELLGNALKFSSHPEKGQIGVGGGRTPEGGVVYCVADDGVGFEPGSAPRLFHAFERLHHRDAFPGAGVGLAVVRRVAERHGGSVWAEGDLERGARFFLALPGGGER
jgi:signal transduction histidine kinase